MKQKIFYALCLASVGVLPTSLTAVEQAYVPEASVQQISVQFGYQRPFSFYYPYNYQFYYPRQQHNANAAGCSWLYTNGSYVYYCN